MKRKLGTGDRFQRETRYERGRLPGGGLDFSNRPETELAYPEARRFFLEPPEPRHTPPLGLILKRRKSVRRFSPAPLSLEDLGYLLWACSGVRDPEGGRAFRTAPSAGALYPIETYLVVNRVRGLVPGLYHYFSPAHVLELLRPGDLGPAVSEAALDQKMCLSAAVVFAWTAVFERSKWKYGQRAYRYIYLDAGHMAQNLALAATAIGLGTCAIGAIYDNELDALLGVDGETEAGLYMTVAGHPAREDLPPGPE